MSFHFLFVRSFICLFVWRGVEGILASYRALAEDASTRQTVFLNVSTENCGHSTHGHGSTEVSRKPASFLPLIGRLANIICAVPSVQCDC